MKKTVLAALAATGLAGLGLAATTLPSAALPMNAAGVTAPANADLVQVRMHRRHRMRRGSASRGNAGMPSRSSFGGQQYGQTTGGPRR